MAYKCREEIVGKRFLSVSGFTKLKLGKICEWGWRAGVIRAATHRDNNNKELQVNDKKLNTRQFARNEKGGVYLPVLLNHFSYTCRSLPFYVYYYSNWHFIHSIIVSNLHK